MGALKPQRAADSWQRLDAARESLRRQEREAGTRRRRRACLVASIGTLGGLLLTLGALDFGHSAAGSEQQAAMATAPATVAPQRLVMATPVRAAVTAPNDEGGLSASAMTEAPSPEAPKQRWQMPLKAWSAVTDRYGAPRGNGMLHGGIDLALDGMHRSRVFAACEGVVASATYSAVYGNHVIVDCGEGWSTLYGHLSEIDVAQGQAVVFEDVLGLSGSSGQAQGEHLHFEIRWQGRAVNPEKYLDFHIPPWAPLTYDKRDANGNLITPEPEVASTPTPEPTSTPTLTPTPTNTPTPRPTRTAAEEATAKAITGTVRR